MPEVHDSGLIDHDIPCAECGYDLRGLSPPGRCPECGHDLADSLKLFEREHRSVDPWWASQITEGAALTVLALLLMLLPLVLPDWMANYHTFGRKVLLGIGVSWWVLGFYSIWKITAREPGYEESRQFRASRWVTRTMVIAYGSGPVLFAIDDYFWQTGYLRQWFGVVREVVTPVWIFSGVFAGLFFYAVLRNIGWRIRSRWISIEAMLLGVLSPLLFLYACGDAFRFGPSSLQFMVCAPLVHLGSYFIIAHAISRLLYRGLADPLPFAAMPMVLWVILFLIHVAWRVRRAARDKGLVHHP